MTKTNRTDLHTMEASPTPVNLADTQPGTAAPTNHDAGGAGKRRRLKRMITGLALAAAAAGAVAALPSGVTAASAQGFQYQNVDLTPNNTFALMLDVAGASQSPGAQVISYWWNGGNNQKWDFDRLATVNGIPAYAIVNANSGQCLTTDNIAGDPVEQEPCGISANQVWLTNIGVANGAWAIQSYSSGLQLEVYGDSPWPGAVIDTWYYNGNPNQYFSMAQDT
jgi:hypothetical protein